MPTPRQISEQQTVHNEKVPNPRGSNRSATLLRNYCPLQDAYVVIDGRDNIITADIRAQPPTECEGVDHILHFPSLGISTDALISPVS